MEAVRKTYTPSYGPSELPAAPHFFPGPHFTPPSPKASPSHSKPQASHAPHQKSTLQKLPSEPSKARRARYPERQQVLAIFQKKNRNRHFRGGKKKEPDEAFWGSQTRAGRRGGEESPTLPIASPALSPPLRLEPAPPALAPPRRLGPAPLPRLRPAAAAPPRPQA
uniref:Uncharacterized protein n=1 Tax=Rangifer tarandus platyrhynchus TaxID=3082113 RepID=A0ACB0DTL4_RANTA|nr:unnamed protein product [Rangifer tarandus platyrhynchus]